MKYDRVYWWSGGTEYGQWRETFVQAGEQAWDVAERIMYQGRVAIPGMACIGMPEGPPQEWWWKRVAHVSGMDRFSQYAKK